MKLDDINKFWCYRIIISIYLGKKLFIKARENGVFIFWCKESLFCLWIYWNIRIYWDMHKNSINHYEIRIKVNLWKIFIEDVIKTAFLKPVRYDKCMTNRFFMEEVRLQICYIFWIVRLFLKVFCWDPLYFLFWG